MHYTFTGADSKEPANLTTKPLPFHCRFSPRSLLVGEQISAWQMSRGCPISPFSPFRQVSPTRSGDVTRRPTTYCRAWRTLSCAKTYTLGLMSRAVSRSTSHAKSNQTRHRYNIDAKRYRTGFIGGSPVESIIMPISQIRRRKSPLLREGKGEGWTEAGSNCRKSPLRREGKGEGRYDSGAG